MHAASMLIVECSESAQGHHSGEMCSHGISHDRASLLVLLKNAQSIMVWIAREVDGWIEIQIELQCYNSNVLPEIDG